MSLALPLELQNGVRTATVTALGPGNPPAKTMRVAVDGIAEEQTILAPPKDVPAKGARIAVRLLECGSWGYAGGADR